MWLVRVERPDSKGVHILYKTENGARNAIIRIEKDDPDVKCRLFREDTITFKQMELPF